MEACTVAEDLTPEAVLALVPQQEPFRFIDEILELDDEHIVAAYRFRENADFYRGHFPGNPVNTSATKNGWERKLGILRARPTICGSS